MKGRSRNVGLKRNQITKTNHNNKKDAAAPRRGRPKGSKNKPKNIPVPTPPVEVVRKKRGRPKGSKNKPKADSTPLPVPVPVAVERKPQRKEVLPVCKKPVMQPLQDAVCWLLSKMHPSEVQYYRKRASKLELDLEKTMALDLLAFFNVQDQELRKQIKTALTCNS